MVGRFVAIIASLFFVASSAAAQDVPPPPAAPAASTPQEAAREAFERGLSHLRAQDWAAAETEFRASLALVERPSSAYNLAFVLFKQGRLRESAQRLQRLLSSTQDDALANYRDYAKQLLAQVVSQMSMLYLTVRPANARVVIDAQVVALNGEHRALPIDPGMHQLSVSAPSFVSRELTIVTRAREDTTQAIELAPVLESEARVPLATTAVDTPPSTLGPWLVIASGAALLAAAAVTGSIAAHQDADFSKRCPSHANCDPSLKPARDRITALGAATDVLLGIGALGVVGGITYRVMIGGGEGSEARPGHAFGVTANVAM